MLNSNAFLSIVTMTALMALTAPASAESTACPSLAGRYTCRGSSKSFTGAIVVRQGKNSNGDMYYQLPYVVSAASNPVYTRLADGQVHSRTETTHMGQVKVNYQTLCSSPGVITIDTIPALGVNRTSKYSLMNGNLLVSEQFRANGTVILTGATCTPN